MFVAKHDYTVNIEDNRAINKTLNTVIRYEELDEHDHMSFFIAKDMTYMDKMIDLIQKHNPVPSIYKKTIPK